MGACEVVGRIWKLLKEILLNLREGEPSHDAVLDQIIHQFCVRSVLSFRLVIVLARMLIPSIYCVIECNCLVYNQFCFVYSLMKVE